jgi:glycosyltransferase involved in cell wall biosynthesis
LSAAPGQAPELTIVIPYWDLDPQILLDAVSSLSEQGATYRTIVVDNASTVPLPPLPPHVEVLSLPRRVGVGAARNAGLAVVETSHVLFLDADDQLFPGSIPFLAGQLEERPDAVASSGGGSAWWPDPSAARVLVPRRRRRWHRRLRLVTLQRRPGLLRLLNTVYMIFQPSCALLRTDAVRRAGGFSTHEAEEDWVLSALLLFQGDVIAGTRDVRRYRMRVGSLNRIKHRDRRSPGDAPPSAPRPGRAGPDPALDPAARPAPQPSLAARIAAAAGRVRAGSARERRLDFEV